MIEHSFNTFLAEKYGVNVAIFLNNMVFWTRTNASNEKNFYENRYWAYGTPKFFAKYFPYFKPRLIKDIITKCIDKGLIIKGNYNKNSYDRTNWYSLSDKLLIELNLDRTCLKPASELIGRKTSNRLDEKRPMDRTKNVSPIPDTKTDTKTDIYTSYNPPLKKPLEKEKQKKENLSLDDLKKENPNQIPGQALKDWLTNRKRKKAPVTKTAWKRVNKALIEIRKQLGIDPVDAFEEMVASNWQSIKVEYFYNRNKKPMTLDDVVNPMGSQNEKTSMYDLVTQNGTIFEQD